MQLKLLKYCTVIWKGYSRPSHTLRRQRILGKLPLKTWENSEKKGVRRCQIVHRSEKKSRDIAQSRCNSRVEGLPSLRGLEVILKTKTRVWGHKPVFIALRIRKD